MSAYKQAGKFIFVKVKGLKNKLRFKKGTTNKQIADAINSKLNRHSLNNYNKSQAQGKAAKRLSPEMKGLRREIREKREVRGINKRYHQRQTDSISNHDVGFRLKEFKERKARQAKVASSIKHADNNSWTKDEVKKIKHAAEIDYNVAGEKTKANLKATVREMKKKGWKNTHTSQHNGRTSSYYLEKDGHKVA